MAVGLLGIFFTTRKKENESEKEKITKPGIFLACVLVSIGLISALDEFNSKNEEEERLEQERKQIVRENKIRDDLLKDLQKVKLDVSNSLDSLDRNLNSVEKTEQNLKKLSQVQIEQQAHIGDAIEEFESGVKRGIARLSNPLRGLRFSLTVHYESAKQSDQEALSIYKPYYIDGEYYGVVGGKPNIYSYQGRGMFALENVSISIFSSLDEIKSGAENAALSYDLEFNGFRENAPIFYSDIEKNIFWGLFKFVPTILVNNDLTYTSFLDLSDNRNSSAFFFVDIRSDYTQGITLHKLQFHDEDSRYVGGESRDCEVYDKFSNLLVNVDGESTPLVKNYRFICPINKFEKITRTY